MRDAWCMRTTLSVDDDVLEAARCLADVRRMPLGAVLSELARKGLRSGVPTAVGVRNGIQLFPILPDAAEVTPELVKSLLEETD